MAQRTILELTDDLDGTAAEESVQFALDGKTYEIDLNARNAGSLREALDALEADQDYLLKGDVFSKDQIEAYIEIKRADVARFEMTPSPVEFDMYYSA